MQTESDSRTGVAAAGEPLLQPGDTPVVYAGRRRWVVASAIGTVVILVAVMVGWAGYAHFRDQGTHEAIDAGQDQFVQVLSRFDEAESVDDLNDAARSAGRVVDTLSGYASDARNSSNDLAVAAGDLLEAQAALVSALAAVERLTPETLKSWQATNAAMTEADGEIDAATERLSAVDAGTARELRDPAPTLGHIRKTVGVFAAGALTGVTEDLLTQLSTARYTTDVQRAAADAAQFGVAVESALAGLESGSADAQVVESVGALLIQVNALAAIDADNLDAWPTSRVALQTAVAGVAALNDIGTRAIGNLNHLVSGATQELSDWKVEYTDAAADRKRDRSRLRQYESGVRTQLRIYSTAREDASKIFDKLNSQNLLNTSNFFYDATREREYIRDALQYMDPPASMRPAHEQLVALLSDAVDVMGIAEISGWDWLMWCEGLIDLPAGCDFRDAASWKEFSAGSSRISKDSDAARSQWRVSLDSAWTALDERKLPVRPAV